MELQVGKEVNSELFSKYTEVIATLPCFKLQWGRDLYNYGNFWYPMYFLSSTMAIQDTFQPLPLDLFIATCPKSGTTWIKALVFAIVNRARFPFDQHHPLLSSGPHRCLPFLEDVYHQRKLADINSDDPSSPRLFGMHIPYHALPLSIKNSDYRIIYLCRDPKDVFISTYHFAKKVRGDFDVPIAECLEDFCAGYGLNGPIWEHILGYWTASVKQPDKIMFLQYEELKAEPVKNVIRLAEFAGYPFSEEELKAGVVEEIVELCSFEKLSNVEVNKSGTFKVGISTIENSSFFRRGKVGDWKEHLTPEMAKKLADIIEQKFEGSGLAFP